MPNKKVEIDAPDWCKGCGICIYRCPVDVLELKEGKIAITKPDNCIGCEMCELICPDFVLKVVEK